jgi:hypothetical protein
MKKKIMALLVALSMAGYMSAVTVNENLSINGFIDGSYNSQDSDAADTQSLGIDEVEIDFLFNAGGVSGELHLDNDNNGSTDRNFDLEQVHMSYTLENGLSVTLGRFGSLLGIEREDPSGLYTYSRAYGGGNGGDFNLGNVDNADNVQEGIRFGYTSDVFGLSASFVNDDEDSSSLEGNDLDFEIAISYTGIENLALGGGAYIDNGDVGETDAINFHAAYTSGKTLVGVEYTEIEAAGVEREGYLVVVDYDVSDKLGVAVRYSSNETGDETDYDKITLAPNYSITESLGAILEYSDVDNGGVDSEEIALELLFTF